MIYVQTGHAMHRMHRCQLEWQHYLLQPQHSACRYHLQLAKPAESRPGHMRAAWLCGSTSDVVMQAGAATYRPVYVRAHFSLHMSALQ
jgi:hypothetical protein